MKTASPKNQKSNGKPVPRFGVKSDTSAMDLPTLISAIKDASNDAMATEWNLAYLITSLWRKEEWAIGRPKAVMETFIEYLQTVTNKEFRPATVRSYIHVYAAYTGFDDALVCKRAVELVLQFPGFSKLEMVIPWVNESNVIDVLQMALKTPAGQLIGICRERWPNNRVRAYMPKDPAQVQLNSFLRYLTGEVPFIGYQMMVPRREPQSYATEAAWHSVMELLVEKTGKTTDELFGEMLKLYASTTLEKQEMAVEKQVWTRDKKVRDEGDAVWPF